MDSSGFILYNPTVPLTLLTGLIRQDPIGDADHVRKEGGEDGLCTACFVTPSPEHSAGCRVRARTNRWTQASGPSQGTIGYRVWRGHRGETVIRRDRWDWWTGTSRCVGDIEWTRVDRWDGTKCERAALSTRVDRWTRTSRRTRLRAAHWEEREQKMSALSKLFQD